MELAPRGHPRCTAGWPILHPAGADASGLDGQRFTSGYLPSEKIARVQRIREIELALARTQTRYLLKRLPHQHLLKTSSHLQPTNTSMRGCM